MWFVMSFVFLVWAAWVFIHAFALAVSVVCGTRVL
jgi:hypothetical protein